MAMTIERDKLKMLPDGDGVRFEGGATILTGEMGLDLYDPYLDEIGRATFLRKVEEQTFDATDMGHAMEFLMHNDIQPNSENAFRLVYGARMHLLFVAGR